jgi:predicted DNA-binding transcriptional regulator AlpA
MTYRSKGNTMTKEAVAIEWVYVNDLSAILMVSNKTIYKWISEKRLPMPIRIGKMRWLKSDIDRWISEQIPS